MRKNKNIVCETRIYSNKTNTHSHPYFQLLFPLRGTMKIKTSDLNMELKTDHLFLLSPKSTHSFYSNVSNQFLVLDFNESVLPIKFRSFNTKDRYLPMDKKWESIRYLLLNEINNDRVNETRVHMLMDYASGFLFESVPEAPSLDYLHHNFNKKMTVEQLSEIENFHPYYYTQWFKHKVGMSPSEYIQHLRLEKAKSLLKETDYPILDIALEVGYNQSSSLTRLFQKFCGTTPRDYRLKFDKERMAIKPNDNESKTFR
ncbi:AraC family transcriptional regulator [Sporolactobacillus sp. THM7-7]|nr:AraC family transcriptional regulator [Sporolactobacillus sp. THM7-7]